MRKSLLIAALAAAAALPASAQGRVITPAEALGERFPNALFLVAGPYESRDTVVLARSRGLVRATQRCIPPDYVSDSGRLWFVYNNRGERAGEVDALSLLIVKSRARSAGQPPEVTFTAFRNTNPWYRGIAKTYFDPAERNPLSGVTLREWNAAHVSGRYQQYDRLFGRRPRDRFHASPAPSGTSSSSNAAWWALPDLERRAAGELVVDARLLRFERAGYDQPTAKGVAFYVTPASFDQLTVKTRANQQTRGSSYGFTLGLCRG